MRATAHEPKDQRSARANTLILSGAAILFLVVIGSSLFLPRTNTFASGGKPALEPLMKRPITHSVGSFLDVSTPTPITGCGAAWSVVQHPTPPGEVQSEFLGLSAMSADDIWAVGYYIDASNSFKTLVEHWDGAQWSIAPSPNVPGASTTLVAVSAISTNDIWAVGHTISNNSPDQTFTMHWDGTTWNIIPSPNPGVGGNMLVSTAAIATDDVWAAGNYFDNTGYAKTLTEHWDGTQWGVVPSPNVGTQGSEFWGVAAVAPDDIWAVGDHDNSGLTLTEHWDGAQWTVISSPNVPGTGQDILYGVSAISSNDVWAVGYANIGNILTMHWDGTQWSLVPAPTPGRDHYLFGVSAVATNDVWSVGDFFDSGGYGHGLSLHWNGSSWEYIPTQDVGLLVQLWQVAPILGSDNEVWAAGDYQQGSTFHTVIEHYSDPCVTPSPTVTGTPPTSTPTYTRTPTRTRTSTVTGTPPTNTPTRTLSPTLTATMTNTRPPTLTPGTPPPCDPETNYVITSTTGATLDPLGSDIGNHCLNCMTTIQLPFHFRIYDQTFTSANVSSNGNIQFASNDPSPDEACLPYAPFSYAIMPFWSQLYTYFPNTGIYTSVLGIAPNRTFNIEWYTDMGPGGSIPANFELRLYENSPTQQFDIIYDQFGQRGRQTTVGIQLGPDQAFTQYECNTYGTISSGLELSFNLAPCATPSATSTSMPTNTPTVTSIIPSTASPTTSPTTSPTACTIQFSDVPQGSTFYTYVRCLACRGIVNGYPDGTFKPNNDVTRGQLSKIVSNSAGFNDDPGPQIYQDVPAGSTFFVWINRLSNRGVMSGYPCGGVGEPCVPPANLPYFRPGNNATRGQISKIDANAAGFTDTPSGQQFQDVAVGSTYYTYTYRLVSRSIMSGYPCGGQGEPCIPPANLPYFSPNNNATRGQTSKIVANTFFPNCQTPSRR